MVLVPHKTSSRSSRFNGFNVVMDHTLSPPIKLKTQSPHGVILSIITIYIHSSSPRVRVSSLESTFQPLSVVEGVTEGSVCLPRE